MILLLIAVTLTCLLIPLYVYALYPVLLWFLSKSKPVITHEQADITPDVTLIISCYNEANVIREKLQNTLAIDYPQEKLQILVVSDASDDGTDEIVREYEHKGITLIRQPARLGKTMGLNLAMQQAKGEMIVFSDANAVYEASAIRKLVRNFADPRVGYVVGAALYTDGQKSASAHTEGLYWKYELAIKQMESRLHSVVGGDGAIYAIRASLWEPLQEKDINDFVNPLQIIAKGFRGVFEPEAQCFEETAGSFDKEIARKERIVNRSIRGLMRVKQVMNPLKTGLFALEVISHKLLRWLLPLFLGLGIIGSALLSALDYGLFQFVIIGALLLVMPAAVAQLYSGGHKLPVYLSLPYYFIMVNIYAIRGILKAVRGETQITWNSARPSDGKEIRIENTVLSIPAIGWFALAIMSMAFSLMLGLIA